MTSSYEDLTHNTAPTIGPRYGDRIEMFHDTYAETMFILGVRQAVTPEVDIQKRFTESTGAHYSIFNLDKLPEESIDQYLEYLEWMIKGAPEGSDLKELGFDVPEEGFIPNPEEGQRGDKVEIPEENEEDRKNLIGQFALVVQDYIPADMIPEEGLTPTLVGEVQAPKNEAAIDDREFETMIEEAAIHARILQFITVNPLNDPEVEQIFVSYTVNGHHLTFKEELLAFVRLKKFERTLA